LTLLLALITVELKDVLYAILSFCGFCIAVGALFWILSAPYVAVFQLLVYAGAIVALFLAAVMMTIRKKRWE